MAQSRRMDAAPLEVSPEEFEKAVRHIKAGNPPKLAIASVAELLKAVELGVGSKAEARELLGFRGASPRTAAAQAKPRRGGRFAAGK
jgi:hypothetical protein